jgi:hypothetical protein
MPVLNAVFTQMQDEFFRPINLVLKYVGSTEICIQSGGLDYAKPDRHELDHARPHQGLHCQMDMCKQHREQNISKVK